MKRSVAVSLAVATTLLGTTVTAPALAQDRNMSRGEHEATQMDYGQRDRSDRDDRSERWGDRDRAPESGIEGRWITKRNYGPPPDAYSRWSTSLQVAALPRRLVIDQRRNVIRVEDFRGRLIQRIVIADLDRSDQDRHDVNRGGVVLGEWRDSKLVTVRRGFRDTRIVQTFALANHGRTLVVYTRQDGRGRRNDVEFTNVYQKV
jgi:hypothetical protein